MLVTGHADLRDRYQRWSPLLDLAVSCSFFTANSSCLRQTEITLKLTPYEWIPRIGSGCFGFVPSSCRSYDSCGLRRVDQTLISDHSTCTPRSERESGVSQPRKLAHAENCQRVLSRYDLATEVGIVLPEKQFLVQKRNHLRKIELSRQLDKHPSASLLLLKIRLWLRDNRRGKETNDKAHGQL